MKPAITTAYARKTAETLKLIAKGHEAKAQGALDECRKLVEGAI